MGLLGGLARLLEKRWRPLPAQITTSWLLSSAVADTGDVVTPDSAMQAAAVFACVNVIASTIATLPIRVIRKRDCKTLDDHPVARLLNCEPNPDMTAAAFREASMVNLLLWGNEFAYIDKQDGITPNAIYPLRSAHTTPSRYPGGLLQYRTITGSASYVFDPGHVLHVQDISYDGIVGLSRIRYAANAIGLALAMEKFGAKFFANGANLGGILELPAGMKPEAITNFVASWKREYTGSENSLKTALLTDGMKFTKTGTDPRNAQMVDTRVFEVREIARLWRVPLHKIGDLERATFSNIEQQSIEFMQDCIQPWCVKKEQEYNRKLLTEAEREEIEIRHDLDSLLRGDTTMRFAAYNTALQSGWMTRNEVRRREGMPAMEGGDVPLQPLNMGNAGGNPAKEPAPAPAAVKAAEKAEPAADGESDTEDESEA